MSNITLTIETSVIGTEPTNSVNARDLHTNLGVRKDFSDWIKGQINNLNLDENVDYCKLALKGEQLSTNLPLKGESSFGHGGNRRSVEYIITLDTAKHIAMASRTPRGKEVRTYFIEAEKKLKQIGEAYHAHAQTPAFDINAFILSTQETHRMLASTLNHVAESITLANHTLNNVSTMVQCVMENQLSISDEMKAYRIDQRRWSYMMQFGHTTISEPSPPQMISEDQAKKIHSLITANAKAISEKTGIDTGIIAAGTFAKLKDRYSVPSYTHLPSDRYAEVVLWVGTIKTAH